MWVVWGSCIAQCWQDPDDQTNKGIVSTFYSGVRAARLSQPPNPEKVALKMTPLLNLIFPSSMS